MSINNETPCIPNMGIELVLVSMVGYYLKFCEKCYKPIHLIDCQIKQDILYLEYAKL